MARAFHQFRGPNRAKKTVIEGIEFPSMVEAARYCLLKKMERMGQISKLKLQAEFTFACGVKYIADFAYMQNDGWVVEDAKGSVLTEVFRIKKKLMAHEFGIPVQVVTVRDPQTIIAAYKGEVNRG